MVQFLIVVVIFAVFYLMCILKLFYMRDCFIYYYEMCCKYLLYNAEPFVEFVFTFNVNLIQTHLVKNFLVFFLIFAEILYTYMAGF